MANETPQQFITKKAGWHGALPENRRSHWRYNEETGIYNNKPTDPQYFKKYMAVKTQCPNCSKMVARGDLSKHKKRPICINNTNNTNNN